MNAKAYLVTFDPERAPLAVGDDFIFLLEDSGGVLERLF